MVKNSLIVGCGGIGSRHLQGILKSEYCQKIFLFDISKTSIENCKIKEEEISHSNDVYYTSNWNELPDNYDLIIISTSSNVRFNIFKKICESFTFKNLILEKILFQNPSQYDIALKIIKKLNSSNFWINLPRRESLFYRDLKSRFNQKNLINSVDVYGENWGLSCNALHFIDLICYLSDSNIEFIDTTALDENILSSKRNGYIEFTGTINIRLKNGVNIRVNSTKKLTTINRTIFINISSHNENVFICEGECKNPIALIQAKKSPQKILQKNFQLKYQSDLSADIANNIFKNNHCLLPTLEKSLSDHMIYVRSFLDYFNKIESKTESKISIT